MQLKNFQIGEDIKKYFLKNLPHNIRYGNADFKNWMCLDFYYLFEITHDFFTQPEKKWRGILDKKYKKLLFFYHPDSPTGSEDKYYAINNAYEVLHNNFWRKKYDQFYIDRINLCEKDISNLCKKDFFTLFNFLFINEEKFFKTKKIIPRFGTENSKKEEVKFFYNFWEKYETDRKFDFLAFEKENDKNFTDQYNEKIEKIRDDVKENFSQHLKFVHNLVALAKKYDPRIMREVKENIYAKYADEKFSEADLRNLKIYAEKNKKKGKINWIAVMRCFKVENKKKFVLKELVEKFEKIKK